MTELKLILEMLEERISEQKQESRLCREKELLFASMYADGKIAAYTHAAALLRTYLNAEMPFEIN